MSTLTVKDLLTTPVVYDAWTPYFKGNLSYSYDVVGVGVSDTELRNYFHEMAVHDKQKGYVSLNDADLQAKALNDFTESKKDTEAFKFLLNQFRRHPESVVYHLTCPITGHVYNRLRLDMLVKDQKDGQILTIDSYLANMQNSRTGFFHKGDAPYHRQFAPQVYELLKNEWGFDGTAFVDVSLLQHGDVVADHVNEVVVYLDTICALVSKRTYVNTRGRYFKLKSGYKQHNIYLPAHPISDVEQKLERLRTDSLPDLSMRNMGRMAEAGLLHMPQNQDQDLYDALKIVIQEESAGNMTKQEAVQRMQLLLRKRQ